VKEKEAIRLEIDSTRSSFPETLFPLFTLRKILQDYHARLCRIRNLISSL